MNPQQRYMAQQYAAAGVPTPPEPVSYPLYGLGQDEPVVPFYRKPAFCLGAGAVVGIGLGYLWWGLIGPAMAAKKTKQHAKKNPSEET